MTSWNEAIIPINPFSRPGTKRQLTRNIVWHYTGNPGATARGHFGYFGDTLVRQDPYDDKVDTYASAHLFIDPSESLLIIPLDEVAYHASQANPFSVGVELCIEPDLSFHPATYERAVQIGVELCQLYGLTTADFMRHYDVTRKVCPKRWVEHPEEWEAFKAEVDRRLQNGGNDMQLPTEEWGALGNRLDALYRSGTFTDYTYAVKAFGGELTASELVTLFDQIGAAIEAPAIPLSAEDANKVISFLSAAHGATADPEAKEEFHRLANELRKVSGQL
ncbi:peptidoglycan recognition protein family protein [Paenibacillus koleovorans]|uniref:peptidoglycan recognition protein family protein n=1 Tax=Paenibacillus koleovorans TaxID=121608 RepID=UPI000FDAE30C|nr:N-acetylmuramoyl-L-alanine amidase [Paenibacillus koleovorans]